MISGAIAIVAIQTLLPLAAQPPTGGMTESLLTNAENRSTADGPVLGEIDDPATGGRWLLLRDAEHPGGPGWLVHFADRFRSSQSMARGAMNGRERSDAGSVRVVIHPGDRLILEQHTQIVDAYLEATALEAAVRGARLKVRLRVGGQAITAVAIGAGRVEVVELAEAQP